MSEMTEFEEKLIRVSYGMTINLGNFESERIDCSLTLPLEEEFEVQFDKMFRKVKMKVMDKGGKFDAKQEALQPDREYADDPRLKDAPKIEVEEEILMDLTNVLLLIETEKAVLAVKKGYQKWVPLSLIHAPKEYDLGGTYDIILRKKVEGHDKSDPDDWFHKKAWNPFNPQKEAK